MSAPAVSLSAADCPSTQQSLAALGLTFCDPALGGCGHPLLHHETEAVKGAKMTQTLAHRAQCGSWKLNVVFPKGASCLHLRQKVFEFAQTCFAYDASVSYTTNEKGVIDASCDLVCVLYFESKEHALQLQNHAKVAQEQFVLDALQTEVTEDSHRCTTRVWKNDYEKQSSSPDRVDWDQNLIHKSVSEASPRTHTTTVITDPDTIAMESIADASKTFLKFELAHINADKKGSALGDAPSNTMPLPSDFHDYFDGRNLDNKPMIDIVVKKCCKSVKQKGRIAVDVLVSFTDPRVERTLAPQLRNAKNTDNGYLVRVFKHDPVEFEQRITERHNKCFPGHGGKKRSRN